MSQAAVPLEFRNVPVCFPNSHLPQTNREQKEIYGAGWQLKEWESWEALLERHSQGSPERECVTPSDLSFFTELVRFGRVATEYSV